VGVSPSSFDGNRPAPQRAEPYASGSLDAPLARRYTACISSGKRKRDLPYAEQIVTLEKWRTSEMANERLEEVTVRAGFSVADVTPVVGMEVFSGYGKSYAKQVHDALKVRAAVLEQHDTTLALVGIDTCDLPLSNRWRDAVRREIEERCGIPAAHIMLAASHTHSGGPLGWYDPRDFAEASELVQSLVREECPNTDPLYFDWVARQTISAVAEAHRKRQEALLAIGSGREEQAGYSRRFRMANGRVYTHPGKGNPDIVGPAGPIDPEVGVLGAWSTTGELLGCLVNFGCHCTTFSGGVSADYVYYLERTIQAVMGQQAAVVFLPGAAADVTQVDNQSLRAREFGEAWSRRVGTRVGAEALKVLVSTEPGDVQPLAVSSQRLRIPRRRPGTAHLADSRRIVEEGRRSARHDTAWLFAKEILLLEHIIETDPVADVEVQALQIGPAVFLANPSETFAATGLRVKADSAFPYTFVVSLANGCVGYVPPADTFAPDGGGYETVLTAYSNLEVTAEEQIATASVALARGLTPGRVPPIARVDQPQEPWSYGVLGPDLD
jgi:neutral ceramidase